MSTPAIVAGTAAPRRTPVALIVIGAAIIAIVIGVTLSLVTKVETSDLAVMLDSARWLRQGADPYQAPVRVGPGYNLNSPPSLLLFLPLSFLSDRAAFAVWTAISVIGFLVSARLIARELALDGSEARRHDDWLAMAVAAALATSQGVATSLVLGQTTGLLMLLMTAAWIADRHGYELKTGSLLGVAIVLKPFLGVFLVYALWRRSRSMIVGLLVGGSITGVVGFLLGGIGGYLSWVHALGQVTWVPHRLNGSLLALFSRTLSDTAWMFHATRFLNAPEWIRPVWLTCACLVVMVTAVTVVRDVSVDRRWAVICLASLLVSPLGWGYYVPIVAGPIIAVTTRASAVSRALIAGGAALALFPIVLVDRLPWALGVAISSTASWSLLLLFSGGLGRDEQHAIRSPRRGLARTDASEHGLESGLHEVDALEVRVRDQAVIDTSITCRQ
jgi:hypothetical protein